MFPRNRRRCGVLDVVEPSVYRVSGQGSASRRRQPLAIAAASPPARISAGPRRRGGALHAVGAPKGVGSVTPKTTLLDLHNRPHVVVPAPWACRLPSPRAIGFLRPHGISAWALRIARSRRRASIRALGPPKGVGSGTPNTALLDFSKCPHVVVTPTPHRDFGVPDAQDLVFTAHV